MPFGLKAASGNWIILLTVITGISVLTLTPAQGSSVHQPTYWTFVGPRSVADALANILLFVPFGIVASRQLKKFGPTLLGGAVLSLAVEVAQISIPGRYASPLDLVFNTAGTGFGAALFSTVHLWIGPTSRLRLALSISFLSVGIGVLFGGALLLKPSAQEVTAFVEWTPVLHDTRYDGRVIAASMGDRSLRPGSRILWHELLRSYEQGTDTLRLSVLTGSSPVNGAVLLRIVDADSTDFLTVSVQADDVILRYRTKGATVHLDQPELRSRGALLVAGQRQVEIRVWQADMHDCLGVEAQTVCDRRTIGDTWALLLYPAPLFLAPFARVLWISAVLFPAGFFIEGRASLFAAIAVVVTALVAVPIFQPIAPTPASQIAYAIAGLLSGHVFRGALQTRRAAASRPGDPLQRA